MGVYIVQRLRVAGTHPGPTMEKIMHINLSADQQVLVQNLVASGRYPSIQDAICQAIHLLATQEELRKEIQVGVDQAESGELLDHDTVFGQLRSIAATAQQAQSGQ